MRHGAARRRPTVLLDHRRPLPPLPPLPLPRLTCHPYRYSSYETDEAFNYTVVAIVVNVFLFVISLQKFVREDRLCKVFERFESEDTAKYAPHPRIADLQCRRT